MRRCAELAVELDAEQSLQLEVTVTSAMPSLLSPEPSRGACTHEWRAKARSRGALINVPVTRAR